MADIQNAPQPSQAQVTMSLEELRVLVHRLAPEGTFIRHQAETLLPDDHERIAGDLSETLRRFHDRDMTRPT